MRIACDTPTILFTSTISLLLGMALNVVRIHESDKSGLRKGLEGTETVNALLEELTSSA